MEKTRLSGIAGTVALALAGAALCVALPVGANQVAYADDEGNEAAEVTIYRLYNPLSSEHLWTSDYNEVKTLYANNGWGYEGIGWYAADEGTPVYRLYNPALSSHLYTSDANEIKTLVANEGWVYDNNQKPLFYSDGDVSIYRLYNSALGTAHHLTYSTTEYNTLPASGWTQEGESMKAVAKGSTFTKTNMAPSAMNTGWKRGSDGKIRLYADDAVQTGWVEGPLPYSSGDGYFYLDEDGVFAVDAGWFDYDGKKCYRMSEGNVARSQYFLDGGKAYRAHSDCSVTAVTSQYFLIDGKVYHADASGNAAAVVSQYYYDNGTVYHADAAGVPSVASEAFQLAYPIIADCGFDLETCFYWCASQTFDDLEARYPAESTYWTEAEAVDFFNNRSGDCYTMAAGFAVMAQYLGYDARAIAGYYQETSGWTEHGWTEIVIDGTTYFSDPEGEWELPDYDWYMLLGSNYPAYISYDGTNIINP